MEKKLEVNFYNVQLLCDICEDIMSFTGVTLLSHPPKYVHYCKKCEIKVNKDKKYPYIEYN